MWILRNDAKDLVFRISPGKQNVVSRKDGDLLLLGDQSISRKHAELSVHNENQNGGIVLKDLGSKYGTFIVGGGGELTQVAPNEPITLNNGDGIRFGIQWNLWRVQYFPLIVATSTLNSEEKTEVKQVVASLGGEVVSDWQPCCTHLTMNKLTVTVKVVCALACGKPIIVPGYFKSLKEALSSTQGKLPDCKDFVPTLAEALLNPTEVSFTPNPERSKLFSGYTFVAASAKQLARIKPMTTAAGGNAVEFSAKLWPDSKLLLDKTVLMQHTAADRQGSQQSQIPDGYIAAARNLKALGVRCIPEAELGLSILYCSMAQYCNPRFSPQSLFGSSSQPTQQITINCPDSEESIKTSVETHSKIEKSKDGQPESSNGKKRPLEDRNKGDQEHPSKRTNSEDMFSSPNVGDQTGGNSISLKKSMPRGNQPVVDPSLDMFAPSGQSSGQTNQNKNSKQNKTEKHVNEKPSVTNPSLDMFAPSGQMSTKENKNEVLLSSKDIFGSNESRQAQKNKTQTSDESHVPNKKPRKVVVYEEEGDISFAEKDEFSFSSSRKSNRRQVVDQDDGDEFSFSSTRKSNRRQVVDQDDGDEFSFGPNNKNNHQKPGDEPEDDFSFASSKTSKKRNRASNSNMFADKAGPSGSNGKVNDSVIGNKCNKALNENDVDSDDMFAFTGVPVAKRKKNNEMSINVDEVDAEVNLALFSKKANLNNGMQQSNEPTVFSDPPDEKNLITYWKDKTCPVKINEDVLDEEVDDLVKELQNATIVIVKPLVVARKIPAESQTTSTGKNFKKFRKVVGMNKRIVPHIIGGSDLVPHYANCHNIDDILPPSPPALAVDDDDDWGFPKEKKKGKTR